MFYCLLLLDKNEDKVLTNSDMTLNVRSASQISDGTKQTVQMKSNLIVAIPTTSSDKNNKIYPTCEVVSRKIFSPSMTMFLSKSSLEANISKNSESIDNKINQIEKFVAPNNIASEIMKSISYSNKYNVENKSDDKGCQDNEKGDINITSDKLKNAMVSCPEMNSKTENICTQKFSDLTNYILPGKSSKPILNSSGVLTLPALNVRNATSVAIYPQSMNPLMGNISRVNINSLFPLESSKNKDINEKESTVSFIQANTTSSVIEPCIANSSRTYSNTIFSLEPNKSKEVNAKENVASVAPATTSNLFNLKTVDNVIKKPMFTNDILSTSSSCINSNMFVESLGFNTLSNPLHGQSNNDKRNKERPQASHQLASLDASCNAQQEISNDNLQPVSKSFINFERNNFGFDISTTGVNTTMFTNETIATPNAKNIFSSPGMHSYSSGFRFDDNQSKSSFTMSLFNGADDNAGDDTNNSFTLGNSTSVDNCSFLFSGSNEGGIFQL